MASVPRLPLRFPQATCISARTLFSFRWVVPLEQSAHVDDCQRTSTALKHTRHFGACLWCICAQSVWVCSDLRCFISETLLPRKGICLLGLLRGPPCASRTPPRLAWVKTILRAMGCETCHRAATSFWCFDSPLGLRPGLVALSWFGKVFFHRGRWSIYVARSVLLTKKFSLARH